MPFTLVRGDITRCPADAIVNAANPQLAQGGGVCGAIFAAAGPAQLAAACQAAAPCPVGSAVHTPAFALRVAGNNMLEEKETFNCMNY